jgi:formylglycine-generating enzyme
VTACDNCGASRTVNLCGTCTSPAYCSGSNVCCAAETDTAFCSRLGKNCGSVSAADNCGASRAVGSCGTCISPETCRSNNVCVYDFVPSSPSCSGGLTCNGESCCKSIVAPGGTFPQGRSTVAGASDYYAGGDWWEQPEFSSTVSSFALDKYEVTVGRFRKFVDAYVDNVTSAPADGAGANPNIPGSGWQSAWNTHLPETQATFKNTLYWNNQVGGAGANDNKPVVYVSWCEAFAFCIWDGGRLATESEWEYAAAGGADNRLYPWGSATPDCTYANFNNCAGGTYGSAMAVGPTPIGNGRWGHADLAGNVFEWTLDWFSTYPTLPTTNYAKLSEEFTPGRIVRGGEFSYMSGADRLRAAARYGISPWSGQPYVGLRCARSVP